MSNLTQEELLKRIADLEKENVSLRELAAKKPSKKTPKQETGRGPFWSVLSVLLILFGVMVAPAALTASAARTQLTNTDAFVNTYAPLSRDPAIQDVVVQEAMKLFNENIDLTQMIEQVVDGIAGIDNMPPAVKNTLELFKGPLANGVISLVETTIKNFVASDTFSEVWKQALRVTHTQFIALMESDPNGAITTSSDGTIGIQLAPIIETVKTQLVNNGFSFVAQIPSVNHTIQIAQVEALPSLQIMYAAAITTGQWLPWVAIVLLGVGVGVARRRSRALIGAGIALAAGMALVLTALVASKFLFIGYMSPLFLTAAASETLYQTVTEVMHQSAIAVMFVGVLLSVVTWFAGPFRTSQKMRLFFLRAVENVRQSAEKHGITTGKVGEWFYRQRTLLRVVVSTVSAVIILFARPVTVGLSVWIVLLAGFTIVVFEFIQRPLDLKIEEPLNSQTEIPQTLSKEDTQEDQNPDRTSVDSVS